ncbi:MAG: amidase domain-containing protein [Clostridia bacterium]|nr:amidase domain-containing protein [Clostridia bacterium]
MKIIPYNIKKAVQYARTFALIKNPKYYDFDMLGGDCTNFVSQCVFEGVGIMNFTKTFGWYYRSLRDRAPAWTGVDEFFSFMVKNIGQGPYAKVVNLTEVSNGDVIQLQNSSGQFYHSLFVTEVSNREILVCSHTRDALDVPLSSYYFFNNRVLHIEGARQFE